VKKQALRRKLQALVDAVKIDDLETNDEKTKYSKIPLM
jgi:hypothetical protein